MTVLQLWPRRFPSVLDSLRQQSRASVSPGTGVWTRPFLEPALPMAFGETPGLCWKPQPASQPAAFQWLATHPGLAFQELNSRDS